MHRMVVVLPHPEGPTKLKSLPSGTTKSTPSTAFTRVRPDDRVFSVVNSRLRAVTLIKATPLEP
jgi:hypothetical protein